jgi:hypothetical protein
MTTLPPVTSAATLKGLDNYIHLGPTTVLPPKACGFTKKLFGKTYTCIISKTKTGDHCGIHNKYVNNRNRLILKTRGDNDADSDSSELSAKENGITKSVKHTPLEEGKKPDNQGLTPEDTTPRLEEDMDIVDDSDMFERALLRKVDAIPILTVEQRDTTNKKKKQVRSSDTGPAVATPQDAQQALARKLIYSGGIAALGLLEQIISKTVVNVDGTTMIYQNMEGSQEVFMEMVDDTLPGVSENLESPYHRFLLMMATASITARNMRLSGINVSAIPTAQPQEQPPTMEAPTPPLPSNSEPSAPPQKNLDGWIYASASTPQV